MHARLWRRCRNPCRRLSQGSFDKINPSYPNGGCHKSENWQNYLRGGPTHRFLGNFEVLSYSKQALLQIVPLPYSEAIDPDDNMSKVLYSGPRSKPYGRKPLTRFQPPQRVERHRLSDATFKEISQVLFH